MKIESVGIDLIHAEYTSSKMVDQNESTKDS